MTPSNRPTPSLGGLIAPLAILAAAAVAILWGPAEPGHRRAVVFAATVCLMGTVAAGLAGRWPATSPSGRVTASLAATALRIFPALIALGWLQAGGEDLRASHGGELLVAFYLVALAVDLVRTIMGATEAARRPRDRNTI